MKPKSVVRVRPAEWKDTEAISQVTSRNGVGSPDPAAWREIWEAYPFAEEFHDIPTGWVLETESGEVVGNLSNVHMLYQLGARRLRGAIASAWAVDPDYRSKSLLLMTTFFKQKAVDLIMNVSANAVAARVHTAMKTPRIPIPDYGVPCLWAIRPRAFARAVLLRRSIAGAGAIAWPAGLLLLARDIVRQSGRGSLAGQVRRVDKFGDQFDAFWQKISGGAPRLRAIRSSAVLSWRFRVELRERRIAILTSERNGMLAGYAVLVRRAGSELGMAMYDVADIQADGDNGAVLKDLLLGAVQAARDDGLDALKFLTGLPAKRGVAEQLRPYTYHVPFWQQYFHAASPEMAAALSGPDAWDFSWFDTF